MHLTSFTCCVYSNLVGLSIVQHFVTDTNNDTIPLTDGSPLLASNVLVQIYDNDIGGVIIRESNGITALAEMNATHNEGDVVDSSFYEDEYYIRLTKEPVEPVEILITSIPVATDYNSTFTPDGRDLTNRTQVYVDGLETKSIIFTSANWSGKKTSTAASPAFLLIY